jgi:hypothetical protein
LAKTTHKIPQRLFQLLGLLGHQGFPSGVLQLLLGGLLLTPEIGHPLPQLLQLDQAFLIGIQKFVDLEFGALEALLQVSAALLQWVCPEAFVTTAIELCPNQFRLFKEIDNLLPHHLIQILHSDRFALARLFHQMPVSV